MNRQVPPSSDPSTTPCTPCTADPEPALRNPPPSPRSRLSPRPSLFSWPLTCCHPHILLSTGPPELTNYFYRSLGREEFNMIRTGSHIFPTWPFVKQFPKLTCVIQPEFSLSDQIDHKTSQPYHRMSLADLIHNYLMLYLSSSFCTRFVWINVFNAENVFLLYSHCLSWHDLSHTLLLQTPPASWPRKVFVLSYILFFLYMSAYICICKYLCLSCVHIVQPFYSQPASWILVQYNEVPESQ